MSRPASFPAPFRLGEWTVHPDRNRVRGPGGGVRLEPRVMAVLVRLAARPGEVVSRQELLDDVWGDAVVGEEILTRAISELRRVFGDRAREPRYIETIINKGYRLIPPVTPLDDETPAVPEPPEDPAPPAPVPEPIATAPVAPARPHRRRLAGLAAVLVLVAAVVWWPRERPAPSGGPGQATPLTSFPGHERQPTVTPDGLRVAFAWAGPEGDEEGIWVKQRNSETPLRLSGGPGLAAWPAWSPDGQTVAWVQLLGGVSQIRTVPSLGGVVRTLLTVPGTVAGLDWEPSGELVFAARDTVTGLHRLRRLDPATLTAVDLDPGGMPPAGEIQPRSSSDGTRLAWIRLGADGTSALWVGDRDGRARREVLAGRAGLAGLAWTSDGRGLVVGVDYGGSYGLWFVGTDGAGLRRLTEFAEFAWNPDVADRTGELVYEQVRVDQDLWRIRILGTEPWQLETRRFLASTRWEYAAEYSPAGDRLAVVSARSGAPELWVCAADGSNLQRLTDTGEAMVARPRWSPDGLRIAVDVRDWDRSRVVVVPAAGGPPEEPAPEDGVASWGDERPVETAGLALTDPENLRATQAGIFWVTRSGGQAFLMLLAPGAAESHAVTDLPGFAGSGLTVAPDGTAVVYPRLGPAEGDLMRLASP